jgi:hypothetical protein
MVFIIKSRESTRNKNGRKYKFKTRKNGKNTLNIFDIFHKRILKDNQLKYAESGLYTWIIKYKNGNNMNPYTFYAAKTFTKQEIGTLHVNLKMLTNHKNGPSDVYIAGELNLIQGSPPIAQFNLLSGTYMEKVFKREKTMTNKLALRDDLINKTILILSNIGIQGEFLSCTDLSECSIEEQICGKKLIEHTNIRTSNENMALLTSLFNYDENISGGNSKRAKNSFKYFTI